MKFHAPESEVFKVNECWLSSSGHCCWIVNTRRFGPDKWDVEVTARYSDGAIFDKDAWNFQVRHFHSADKDI